jgi:hypothetical protein
LFSLLPSNPQSLINLFPIKKKILGVKLGLVSRGSVLCPAFSPQKKWKEEENLHFYGQTFRVGVVRVEVSVCIPDQLDNEIAEPCLLALLAL